MSDPISIPPQLFNKYVLWVRQPPFNSWLPIITGVSRLDMERKIAEFPHRLAESSETFISEGGADRPDIGRALALDPSERPGPKSALDEDGQHSTAVPRPDSIVL